MTYRERKFELAKSMAKAYYAEHLKEEKDEPPLEEFIYNAEYRDDYVRLIDILMPLAAICLEEMASIYEHGYGDGSSDSNIYSSTPYLGCKEQIKSLGLIPTI